MSVLTQLRKAANHPLLLRSHYSDDIIASMSTEILKVGINVALCFCPFYNNGVRVFIIMVHKCLKMA